MARETTLGALTAADLGKRVALPLVWGGTSRGILCRIDHKAAIDGGAETFVGFATSEDEPDLQRWGRRLPSTTRVTVYDKEADDDR